MSVEASPSADAGFDKWSTAGLLIIGVYAVYSPYIARVFDYHDSFFYFTYLNHQDCMAHPQSWSLVLSGRPLFMLLNCGVATVMNTVSDARVVRLVSLAALSVSGIPIVGLLRSYGVHRLVAVGTVIGLLTIPGWQPIVSMSQAAAIVWSLPPVAAAFVLLHRVAKPDGSTLKRVSTLAAVVGLLLVATLTYQQNSSIVFALCIMPVVLSPVAHGRRMVLWAICAYAISGMAYFAIHRLFTLPVLAPWLGITGAMIAEYNEKLIVLTTDYFEKARLFAVVTPRVWALWFIDSFAIVPVAIALVAIMLGAANFRRDLRESTASPREAPAWSSAIQRLVLLIMLVPLSAAPFLLSQGTLIVYRHVIGYQWLVLLFMVAAATRLATDAQLARRVVRASLATTLVAGVFASWNLDRNLARINAAELRFVERALRDAEPKLPAPVVVIQPHVFDLGTFSPGAELGDEFNRTSTMYPQDVPGVVYGAAAEINLPRWRLMSVEPARIDPADGRLQILDVTGKVQGDRILNADTVVIDMRQFVAAVRRGDF